MSYGHVPVMLDEVMEFLQPKDGEVYVDATFGAGGYSSAILKKADCRVIAMDRDASVKNFASKLQTSFPNSFTFINDNFANLERTVLAANNNNKVNGVVFDIGISSMQVDDAKRGFSFAKEGPLDMRMGQDGMDAETFINSVSEQELANIIYKFGGEKKSRKIAKAIVDARQKARLTTTNQLANIVREAVCSGKRGYSKIDPATRTFQAIRIYINDELQALEQALQAAENILLPGGRLIVVTFHSLEDDIVKKFLKQRMLTKGGGISRHMPDAFLHVSDNDNEKQDKPTFLALTKKPVIPKREEVEKNARARSAKLRAASRGM